MLLFERNRTRLGTSPLSGNNLQVNKTKRADNIEDLNDTQMLHRDLKPENVLLDAQGHVKL
jgi:serine/threonine protein kinase